MQWQGEVNGTDRRGAHHRESPSLQALLKGPLMSQSSLEFINGSKTSVWMTSEKPSSLNLSFAQATGTYRSDATLPT